MVGVRGRGRQSGEVLAVCLGEIGQSVQDLREQARGREAGEPARVAGQLRGVVVARVECGLQEVGGVVPPSQEALQPQDARQQLWPVAECFVAPAQQGALGDAESRASCATVSGRARDSRACTAEIASLRGGVSARILSVSHAIASASRSAIRSASVAKRGMPRSRRSTRWSARTCNGTPSQRVAAPGANRRPLIRRPGAIWAYCARVSGPAMLKRSPSQSRSTQASGSTSAGLASVPCTYSQRHSSDRPGAKSCCR